MLKQTIAILALSTSFAVAQDFEEFDKKFNPHSVQLSTGGGVIDADAGSSISVAQIKLDYEHKGAGIEAGVDTVGGTYYETYHDQNWYYAGNGRYRSYTTTTQVPVSINVTTGHIGKQFDINNNLTLSGGLETKAVSVESGYGGQTFERENGLYGKAELAGDIGLVSAKVNSVGDITANAQLGDDKGWSGYIEAKSYDGGAKQRTIGIKYGWKF